MQPFKLRSSVPHRRLPEGQLHEVLSSPLLSCLPLSRENTPTARLAGCTGLTVASSAAVKEVGPGLLAGGTLLQQELVGGQTVDPDMYSSVPVACTEHVLSKVQSLQLHRPCLAHPVSGMPGTPHCIEGGDDLILSCGYTYGKLCCFTSWAVFSLPCCRSTAQAQQHAKRCTGAAPSLCTWLRCFTSPVFAPTSFNTCTGIQDHLYCSTCSFLNINVTGLRACLEVFHCLGRDRG